MGISIRPMIFTTRYLLSPPPASRLLSQEWCRKIWRENGIGCAADTPGFDSYFLDVGINRFLLMVVGTFIYCNVINTPDVKYATLTLAPTILFACLMSIYRGYYEGMQNMFPTAISEVIEALCKLILGFDSLSADPLLWHE